MDYFGRLLEGLDLPGDGVHAHPDKNNRSVILAYDPADLKLPPWLLRLLGGLIRLRFPVAPGWRLAMTRPGVMFSAALAGIWAAAFYSGNNLLYLCGAVMLVLMLAAVSQAAWLLKSFPTIQGKLPMLEAGQVTALRQPLPSKNLPGLNMSAIVDISWQHGGDDFVLAGRCANQHIQLHGRLQAKRRGLFHIPDWQLSTSAPLGLFELTYIRHEPLELIVLPASLPWRSALAGLSDADQGFGEGDQWRDLRAYMPGDALARVHWRKADGDSRNWVVKRFGSFSQAAEQTCLRVDLRLLTGMDEAAFEELLGRACGWIQQHEHIASTLILGQVEFNLSQQDQYRQALKSLAAAQPESCPPSGQGGLLLSLENARC